MTVTLKAVFEGLITQDLSAHVNEIKDAVDALSNQKIMTVSVANVNRYHRADANAITTLDAVGTVNASAIASYASGTFTDDTYDIGRPMVKTLYIGRDKYHVFGITPDMLDQPASRFSNVLPSITVRLNEEIIKFYKDFKQYRRNQVSTMLDELGASSDPALLPKGLQLVADSRVGFWNWDNKMVAALSEAEFKLAINAVAKQTDIDGLEVGSQAPLFLFHASNLTLANEILMPNEVVNAMYKSAGDFKAGMQGFKMAGTYKTVDGNDWVAIFENNEIKRVVMQGYENFQVRIFHDVENDRIGIEMSDWSIMSADSPVGIIKAIVS